MERNVRQVLGLLSRTIGGGDRNLRAPLALALALMWACPLRSLAAQDDASPHDGEEAVVVGDMLLDPGQAVLGDGPEPRGKGVNGNASVIMPFTAGWPDGKLPVVFAEEIDEHRQKLFFSACREWEARVGVKCVPWSDEDAYIDVVLGEGCNSRVGYGTRLFSWGKTRGRTLSLGDGCWSKRIIIHELGHALGLMHEQMRPDRGRYITVLWDNIEPEHRAQYYWIPGYTSGSEYDFDSIMHYRNGDFALESGLPTMEAKPGYEEALERAGTATVPSDSDARALRRFYGEPEPAELEEPEEAPKLASSAAGGRKRWAAAR